MSYIPRNHYLHIHDALRKLIGPKADLAAFVSNQGAFQCNMLINSERTDPDYLQGNTGSVEQFARELQGLLGICDVVPNKRRVDVIFRDRTCIQLALGAAKSSMGGVQLLPILMRCRTGTIAIGCGFLSATMKSCS